MAVLEKIGAGTQRHLHLLRSLGQARHGGDKGEFLYEVADLWFHSMVALAHFGLTPAQVIAELERREGLGGLEEKAMRKVKEREQKGA